MSRNLNSNKNELTHAQARMAQVEDMNQTLSERVEELKAILSDAVAKCSFRWDVAVGRINGSEWKFGPELNVGARPELADYLPEKPSLLHRLVPGWRTKFELREAEAETSFQVDYARYVAILEQRQQSVNEANRQLERLLEGYRASEPGTVVSFFQRVFDQSPIPQGFPDEHQLAFLSDSRQLIMDFKLPALDDVVPQEERYRYTKSSDLITWKESPKKARHSLYASVAAQMVLRRFYEIFQSDREHIVEVVAVNAFVDAKDPCTGRHIRPCLVSARATRDEFNQLDLRHVDPLACLKRLNAAISRSPGELLAVRPVVDIDMADPRFIQEVDVLSTLDTRPNLIELTPAEFENLITNLFQKMGLETKLTQASRDGGVDCVAFDPHPILGGKVVVQAKRYKNTVGVSAVRDLFGTMLNEGATKGILVTTSGYGSAAFEFAAGKPIQLLSGRELLFLLQEHAGINAKIVLPENCAVPGSVT